MIGAGVLAGIAAAPFMGATRAAAEPSADRAKPDLALLRRTFVLADEARRSGSAPYGALVADADGEVIAEHRNTTWAEGGDPTREILCNGSRPITVIGPLLEDEAAQPHEGYWH